jgi:hypothetical protein
MSESEETTKEETVNVFHRWHAHLDVEDRSVTFLVSKMYTLEEEKTSEIDPEDEASWDKVLTLAFPEENFAEVEGKPVAFADSPTFFDTTQLSKRYIPVDEFVRVVSQIMEKINTDLDKAAALEEMSEDSTWNLL